MGQHASLQTVGAGQYPGGQARHDFPDLHPQEIRPRGPGMAGTCQNTDQSLKTKIYPRPNPKLHLLRREQLQSF